MRILALTLILGLAACSTLSGTTSGGSSDPSQQIDIPVSEAPPPDKAEGEKPAAPGYGYIWVAGYWDYLDGNYIWRDGRWVQGKPDYEYVRARYEHEANGWVFHRPHWKRRHLNASAGAQK